jgi:hypothetical protein
MECTVEVIKDIYPNAGGGATFPIDVIKVGQLLLCDKYGPANYWYSVGSISTKLDVDSIKELTEHARMYVYRARKSGAVTTHEIGYIKIPTSEYMKQYPESWCDSRVCEGFWGRESDCVDVVELLNSGNKCVEFADWISNNWYIPATDGWKLDVENKEYTLAIPKVNYFTTEEIYKKFSNNEGEF